MKNLLIFIVISLFIHGMLFLIKPSRTDKTQEIPSKVEIVTTKKKEPVPLIKPIDQNKVKPESVKNQAVDMEKENINMLEPVHAKQKDLTQETYDEPVEILNSTKAIKPKVYNEETIPLPLTSDEYIKESLKKQINTGPDKSIERIIEENLKDDLPPGEDRVNLRGTHLKYNSFFRYFSRELYKHWRYPENAAKRGEAGIARINFSVTKDGTITNIRMLESSGYPDLDRAVTQALKKMAKIPLPDSTELDILHINGSFIYTLTGDYIVY